MSLFSNLSPSVEFVVHNNSDRIIHSAVCKGLKQSFRDSEVVVKASGSSRCRKEKE